MRNKLAGLALTAAAVLSSLLGSPAQADETHTIDAIAHRGYDGYHRENSLVGFQVVLRDGAQAVETDVRFTRDGIAILAHDDWVWSSRCDRYKGQKWASLTWAQVRTVKCDRLPIASLGDVARVVRSYPGRVMYVEPKAGRASTIVNVLKPILGSRFVVESFQTADLDTARNMGADTLYLYGGRAETALSTAVTRDYDAIGPNVQNTTPEAVAAAERAGVDVVAWTPNTSSTLEQVCDAGADGAFTDAWRTARNTTC